MFFTGGRRKITAVFRGILEGLPWDLRFSIVKEAKADKKINQYFRHIVEDFAIMNFAYRDTEQTRWQDMSMKYKRLAEQLREELARDGGRRGYKLPTELELAQRYQMSRQTVRHALQLLAEEGLIQRRQGSGSYATGKALSAPSRGIAVVTSFLDDYIFPTILHDAQAVFAQAGYETQVYATENRVDAEREILKKLLAEPPCGFLIEGAKTALPTPNMDVYQRILQTGAPVLFLHGICAGLNATCVADDNYGGGYRLANYLIGRGRGEIAGIFKSDDIQGPQRYHGAVSAIRDAGLCMRDERFAWYDTEDRRRMLAERDTRVLAQFVRERLEGAQAVICYNDEVAYLLIQELLSAGRRVPEDVAVASFDNSYYSQLGPVPVTSLRHRNSRMGRVAAEQLTAMLGGRAGQSRVLDWELVERSST